MRLIDRRDTSLVIALIVGAVVMFEQPLRFALTIAEDVSRIYHVDLVPGLVIFVLIFTLHHRRRHRATAVVMQLAAHDAEAAKRASDDMERLLAVSQAMSNVFDSTQLRVKAWRHVPPLVGDRLVWIATMEAEEWHWVIEPVSGAEAKLELAPTLLTLAESGVKRHNGWVLLPLRSSGHALGLLAVQDDPSLTTIEQGRIATLAAILGIAVKNVHLFEQMQVNSLSDALTGCFNRAHAFESLNREMRRSKRNHRPLSVVMFDVDGFKAINDAHGHLCGDRLLQAIGEALCGSLRATDVKCRYGGDEFLVILPDSPLEGAEHVADQLRRTLERLEVSDRGRTISCHVSIGVVAAIPNEIDPLALVHRVDEALYRDKLRNSQGLRLINREMAESTGGR
jgi:diguanylate cyclase (GGDEF)-like protein